MLEEQGPDLASGQHTDAQFLPRHPTDLFFQYQQWTGAHFNPFQ